MTCGCHAALCKVRHPSQPPYTGEQLGTGFKINIATPSLLCYDGTNAIDRADDDGLWVRDAGTLRVLAAGSRSIVVWPD